MEMTLEQQQALALAAARVRAQEQEQQQAPQQRSLADEAIRQLGLTARAGYEAFTAPATAVLEAGRGLYNLAAPETAQMPSFYAEQARGLTALGLPEPENLTERAVQAGSQSLLGAAGLARALPKVPAFSAELSRQLPAAATAGLASQPAAELTKEFTGSDIAALLAGVGVGALTATGTAKAISAVESGKTPLYTIDQIQQRASQSYRKVDEAGISVQPASAQNMVTKIREGLNKARLVEGTTEAKELNDRLVKINNILGDGPVEFAKIEEARKIINDLRTADTANLRRFGSVALAEVDDYITSLGPKDLISGKGGIDAAVRELVSARKDWRNASRATMLEDALNVAEIKTLDPKASESELIRRGFINLAADKKKMKQFTKQEQNIIKSVANGGPGDKLLTLVSQFSPLRSKLAAAGGAYAATQSPVMAGSIASAGLAADVAQGVLRKQAAQQAIKQIASGVTPPTQLPTAMKGLLTGIFDPYENRTAGIVQP
jgi:hypothetical protein